MDRIARHLDELRRAYRGGAWHGPALGEVLADVSAEEAAARPLATHTIAEIALHATAWTEEVARRLDGGAPSLPARGDWPEAGPITETTWAGILADLDRARAALEAAVERFPADRLDETVGGPTYDAPLGIGITYATMLLGLAQHDAYHAGQIALLKAALRRGRPQPER